jgi:hypothetical protein
MCCDLKERLDRSLLIQVDLFQIPQPAVVMWRQGLSGGADEDVLGQIG